MSSSVDHPPNLASIAADIVRKIISARLEDVDNMRMISPRWNSLAVQFLANRKNLPVINTFFVDLSGPHLSLRIPQRFKSYFGVEKWESSLIPSDSDFLIKVESTRWRTNEEVWKIIDQIFNRCSRIDTLDLGIGFSRRGTDIRVLGDAIKGVIVDKLAVQLEDFDNIKKEIIDFIGVFRIECVIFNYTLLFLTFNLNSVLATVLEMLRLVPTVELDANQPVEYQHITSAFGATMYHARDNRRKEILPRLMERFRRTHEISADIIEYTNGQNGEVVKRISIVKKERKVND